MTVKQDPDILENERTAPTLLIQTPLGDHDGKGWVYRFGAMTQWSP